MANEKREGVEILVLLHNVSKNNDKVCEFFSRFSATATSDKTFLVMICFIFMRIKNHLQREAFGNLEIT